MKRKNKNVYPFIGIVWFLIIYGYLIYLEGELIERVFTSNDKYQYTTHDYFLNATVLFFYPLFGTMLYEIKKNEDDEDGCGFAAILSIFWTISGVFIFYKMWKVRLNVDSWLDVRDKIIENGIETDGGLLFTPVMAMIIFIFIGFIFVQIGGGLTNYVKDFFRK